MLSSDRWSNLPFDFISHTQEHGSQIDPARYLRTFR